jgi:predicted enzyme related to lactoylglutathione lyase
MDDTTTVTGLGLTFDCADAPRLAAFWALALGYEPAPPPTGWSTWESWFVDQGVPEDERSDGATIGDPAGAGPRIGFLTVQEPKTAKNRLHLDLHVSGGRHVPQHLRVERITAKVDVLVNAGASVQQEHLTSGGGLDHVVLQDPEGNEFCVV